MNKTCPRCKESKPVSTGYWLHKSGLRAGKPNGYCKSCSVAVVRANYGPKQAARAKAYRAENRDRYRSHYKRAGKKFRAKRRAAVLSAYGSKCACCGETTPEFLAVDHVLGGGRKHKRSLHNHLYEWLVKSGFPAGFRLLCHNCNQARGAYGYCPHERASCELPYAVAMGVV